MNFFRKRKREDEEEAPEPPVKKSSRTNRLLSWIKDKFKKSGSNGSNVDQQTPVHRRTSRYIMTPKEAFSPSDVAVDVRNQQFYEFNSVLNITESKNYEFKAAGGRYPTQVLPEHVRKYGSAFLNSDGGVLLAGILDNGVVQGVHYCTPSLKSVILNIIKKEFEKFRPYVDHRKYSVNFVPVAYPQSYQEYRLRRYRSFVPNTFVIELAIRQGDPGEIYEDGLHKVFVRREGSVEGPLSPIKIKELVLQNIREVLNVNDKKRKRSPNDPDTGIPQQEDKKVKVSPIVFNLKDERAS